jgi:hypothetical protein
MSQHETTEEHTEDAQGQATAVDLPENPFEREELAQFNADDVIAGKAIGVMLSMFFLYTMIAMSIVGFWTFCKVFQ